MKSNHIFWVISLVVLVCLTSVGIMTSTATRRAESLMPDAEGCYSKTDVAATTHEDVSANQSQQSSELPNAHIANTPSANTHSDENEKIPAVDIMGWFEVVSDGDVKFKIPPTLEVQGGDYKEVADKFRKRTLNIPRGTIKIVVQQAGLNANDAQSRKHYVRIIYECQKESADKTSTLNAALALSRSELAELDTSYKESAEQAMYAFFKKTGVKQHLLRWDSIEAVPFGNGTAIKLSYCRQTAEMPPIDVIQYRIGDHDRVHSVTFSCRQSEKDIWGPVWAKVMKTFTFMR